GVAAYPASSAPSFTTTTTSGAFSAATMEPYGMSNDRHYDVIIIGTGAGGGTLARKLAPTGKRVLLLERGGYVPREKDNWSTRAVNIQGKYQTKEVWHDREGNPPYPHPAVSHEPRIQQLSEDFAAAGLQPIHTPLGVMLDEKNPHGSKCIRCNTCDGFPCLVYAKSDAQVLGVDPALEYPNVGLMTNAYVERLETDASGGEVRGVVVKQNGATAT